MRYFLYPVFILECYNGASTRTVGKEKEKMKKFILTILAILMSAQLIACEKEDVVGTEPEPTVETEENTVEPEMVPEAETALIEEVMEEETTEPEIEAVSVEYTKLSEDAAESTAIEKYLISRSKIWDVYDVVITGTEEVTTVSFEVPEYMKDYEGDSYIIYAFEGTDFKKVPCELKDNVVSFEAEKSGVYALVQYDSNVWFYDEFVEHSDMIVEEERYIEKIMYTTQETEILDIYMYGNVIGTLPENERVEVNSSMMEWACIYYGDTFGWLPLTSLSDTPQ